MPGSVVSMPVIGSAQPRVEGRGSLRGLAWRRHRAGQGLADRAPVHPVPRRESADGMPVLRVAPDRSEQARLVRSPGHVAARLARGVAARPCQACESAFQDGGRAAGQDGEPLRADGAQVVRRAGEAAVQVAGPQVIGAGQPPDVGADRLPGGRPGPDGQGHGLAGVMTGHGPGCLPGLAACEAMSTGMASMDELPRGFRNMEFAAVRRFLLLVRVLTSRTLGAPIAEHWSGTKFL